MNLVMAEPIKSKPKEGMRLTVAISVDDYQRLEELKTKILRAEGKKPTTQDLASQWISEGIASRERELATQ